MFHLKNLYFLHQFEHINKDKMFKIYFLQFFFTIFGSLFNIFVAAYLYNLGFSLYQILFGEILLWSTVLLLLKLNHLFLKNIGIRITLILSFLCLLCKLIALNYVEGSLLFFSLVYLFEGLFSVLFWPTFHYEISRNISEKKEENQFSIFYNLGIFIGVVSPIIGGFLLENLSFTISLLTSGFILFIGTIPLIFSNEKDKVNIEFSYKEFANWFLTNKNDRNIFLFEGVEYVLMIIWTILLFTFLNKNFFQYGLIISFSSILVILTVNWIKKIKVTPHKSRDMLKMFSIPLMITWVLKFFSFLSPLALIYSYEFLFNLSQKMRNYSYHIIFYKKSKSNMMKYLVYREFNLVISRMITCSIVIIIILLLDESILVLSSILLFGIISTVIISKYN